MTTDSRVLVETLLRAFVEKNLKSALDCFADDALFIDPHYPEPHMQGKAAIQEGFQFTFNILKKPGFTIRHFWGNENNGALEVDTHHIFQDDNEVRFPQMFAFELRDGLLTRFQAYVPYPPPSPAG